jgi:hypothetical protein
MKLRVLMLIVAILAIVLGLGLGLRRRSIRFSEVALTYGREANRLENQSEQVKPDQLQPLLDRAHWNDAVADAYRKAASKPWIPSEPQPEKIVCQCGYHAKIH